MWYIFIFVDRTAMKCTLHSAVIDSIHNLCAVGAVRYAPLFRRHLHLLAAQTSLRLSGFLFPTRHSLSLEDITQPFRYLQAELTRTRLVVEGWFWTSSWVPPSPTCPRNCPRHPDSIPLGLKARRAFACLLYSPATATTHITNYVSEIREQAQGRIHSFGYSAFDQCVPPEYREFGVAITKGNWRLLLWRR